MRLPGWQLTGLGQQLGLIRAAPLTTRVEAVAAAALYVLAVHWSYRLVIVPDWTRSGLVYQPAADGSLIVAMLAAVAPALWLPLGPPRISSITLWILYAVPYVPASLVPHYLLGTGWALVPLNLALLVSTVLLALGQRIPRPRFALPSPGAVRYATVAVVLGIVTGVILIAAFGLGDLPALGDVYGTRADYKETAQTLGRFFGYLIGAAGTVLYPLLIVLAIAWRRWTPGLVGLAGVVLVYSITGYKSVLISVPLALFVFVLVRFVPRQAMIGALLGLASAIAFATVTRILIGGVLGALIRRAIDVPGQLTAYYFDYFSVHPTYGLSHSVLGWLGGGDYSVTPPTLIATVYFGKADANANANLWADGFANFGLAGILGVTLMLIGLLWLADAVAHNKPIDIAAPVFASAAFSLTNSALLTSLLSHGIVAALIAIALLPRAQSVPISDFRMPDRVRAWAAGRRPRAKPAGP